MESALNTYNKGLNKDLSKNKYSPESYYDASNIQVVSDEATSTLAVTNEKGNSFSFSIPVTQAVVRVTLPSLEGSQTDVDLPGGGEIVAYSLTLNGITHLLGSESAWTHENLCAQINIKFATNIALGHYRAFNQYDSVLIVGLDNLTSASSSNGLTVETIVPILTGPRILGWRQLRDYLIVLTTTQTGQAITDAPIAVASNGQIWKVPINTDGTITGLLAGKLVPSLHLACNNALNFNVDDRPEIYTNYESPEVGKVYWTDNSNGFRHFNTLDPNCLATRVSAMEIVPDVNFGSITINSVTTTGTYKAGMVQYAYQYYNLHGSQSAFSPTSGLVHITESSESLGDSQRYFGAARDTQCGKAVSITIDGIDQRFTNIRTVALFYTTDLGTPEIRIIDDREVPPSTTSITVVDGGNTIKGTVTSMEFTSLGSINFKCKTIETKDNIMFPANIEEDFFDIGTWDARAYRCDFNGECVVKTAAGTEQIVNTTSFSLLNTHDAIQSKEDQYTYKYLPDTSRFGGQGKNVKYYFAINSLLQEDDNGFTAVNAINAAPLSAPNNEGNYTNYASPLNHANYVGYQRDEVYRFGVVFKDDKGRKSFVAWIADIKMPAIDEMDIVGGSDAFKTHIVQGDKTFIRVLHPVFQVDNWPDGAVSCEIVRVKREDYDKTIKSQGFLFSVQSSGGKLVPYAIPTDGNGLRTSLLLFASPEVNFLKKSYNNTTIKLLTNHSVYALTDGQYSESIWSHAQFKYGEGETILTVPIPEPPPYEMKDQRIIGPGYEATYIINNTTPYSNYRYYSDQAAGYMGTVLVFGLDTQIPVNAGMIKDHSMLANIEQSLSAQYGGNSYPSRFNNKYISCNAICNTAGEVVSVYGGDTFIGYFDYQYGLWDLDGISYNSSYSTYAVVESSINLALRHDVCTSKTTAANSYLIQETAGTQKETDGEDTYPQTTDLYLYNTVYSRENDITTFFSKPLNFSSNKTFDVRILSSKPKILNEEIDSWTSYLATNYIDLDGSYGPITKLATFNNRLYFYQNRAFGWLNVNERSLITPDASGSTLALGKGGVLDQSFYISRYSGTKHQFSVVGTPNGLYSYDAANNKLNWFNGESNISLSESKGLSSTLKNFSNPLFKGADTTLLNIGVHGVYDVRFNRVLWTFKDDSSVNEMTISYNEMLEAFESFHDYKPCIYGTFDDKLFSVDPEVVGSGYLHNVGSRGEFYGATYDSFITLLFNKDPHQIKLVTNLEYLLGTYPDEYQNFKEITVWNDYQTTGVVTTSSDNSRRLMRRWRYTVPRDSALLSDARIRSEYVFIKLLYENSNDKKFSLFDMITHYIPRA